jgi:hypothetical protein
MMFEWNYFFVPILCYIQPYQGLFPNYSHRGIKFRRSMFEPNEGHIEELIQEIHVQELSIFTYPFEDYNSILSREQQYQILYSNSQKRYFRMATPERELEAPLTLINSILHAEAPIDCSLQRKPPFAP